MSLIHYLQAYVSSTDTAAAYPNPIDSYCRETSQPPTGREWISAKSCSYPQEIGLCLPRRAYVKSIRIATQGSYAPSKVELFVGDDAFIQDHFVHPVAPETSDAPLHLYFSADCRPLCTIDWREAVTVDGTEEVRVDVHEPLNVLKIVLHAPRSFNVFNQVAIMQLELRGVEMDVATPVSDAHLSRKASLGSIQAALLETGVPADVVRDLGAPPASLDEYTKKAIAHVLLVKADCVAREDYPRAQTLTEHATTLASIGQQMQSLARLKSVAIGKEDYDAALTYHNAMETLHATREIAIARAFESCQPAVAATPVAPIAPPTVPSGSEAPAMATVLDIAIRTWCREESPSPSKTSAEPFPPAQLPSPTRRFLETMFGAVFVEASQHSNWKVRRACVEVAEQYIAVFGLVFDTETLYEMYSVWVESLCLRDKTVPVVLAVLNLTRSIFEKPMDAGISFGTYGLRRGVLRPLLDALVAAILSYCCRFNTLLREDCIRTLRFLAQQRHVADVVLAATWRVTQGASDPFLQVLGLKCLQDLLYTYVAFDLPLPKEPLLGDIRGYMQRCADDTNADVSGTALDCLTLLHALLHHEPLSVSLEVEAHVPLFRKFPFPPPELARLVAQVETYARLHNLPTQLRTYVLDEASLEGFESTLKKGSVSFVGSVEKRPSPNQEPPRVAFTGTIAPRPQPIELPPLQIESPPPVPSPTSISEPFGTATLIVPLQAPTVTDIAPVEAFKAASIDLVDLPPEPSLEPVVPLTNAVPDPLTPVKPEVEVAAEIPPTDRAPTPVLDAEEPTVPKPVEPSKDAKSTKRNQITPTNDPAPVAETKTPQQLAADDKIGTLKVVDQVAKKAKKNSSGDDDKKGCAVS
ncbi:hypothetical protein ACHHYP_02099 [Achlya hypogyna]|uniref:Centrosomal protein CEP104 N-terminal domain-containing protein n=1 Tax=Achlya hypogyna TaxID=1202772 RepID=A0A1V9Z7C7_ACHHY|nr:hypothetical protein ACHHYP_02099 [Achlya hypogyna]